MIDDDLAWEKFLEACEFYKTRDRKLKTNDILVVTSDPKVRNGVYDEVLRQHIDENLGKK